MKNLYKHSFQINQIASNIRVKTNCDGPLGVDKRSVFYLCFCRFLCKCDNTKVNQQKLKIENVNQFNFSKGVNLEDYYITAVKELHKYSYKRKLKNLFNKIIRK